MRTSQDGFSMLEILISMVIVGLLAASLFYFLSAQNKLGLMSTDTTKGLHYGKQALDSIKVSEYDNISAGSDTTQNRYIRSWNVTTVSDGFGVPTGRKEVQVNVFWPLTGEHGVSMVTLLSDDDYKENP